MVITSGTQQAYGLLKSLSPRPAGLEPPDSADLNSSSKNEGPAPRPPIRWAHRVVAGGYTAATWGRTAAYVGAIAATAGVAVLGVAVARDLLAPGNS